MKDLDELLYPITPEDFRAAYFEQAPLHIPKFGGAPFLDASDFDALIRATSETQPHRLRANSGGRVLAPPRSSSAKEIYDWAKEVHADGATLVINYVEALDLRCGAVASALGSALDAQVTFTVFMTPAEAQGFSPHFDTLDVFVLQVDGTKEWYLGEVAVRLPTLRQGYLVEYNDETPIAHQQVTMAPGHVLYIPRGVVHWARTSTQHSVHITADIDTATAGDVLSTAVRYSSFLETPNAIQSAANQRLIHLSEPLGFELDILLNSMQSSESLPALCKLARTNKWARHR